LSDDYIENVFTGKTIEEILSVMVEKGDLTKDHPTGRSSNTLFQNRIYEIMKDARFSNKIYKEVLRALLSQFNLYYVDDQERVQNVSIHHGRSERAVAKMFQENNLILPYASVILTNISDDTNKRRFEPVLIQRKLWNHDTQRAERIISFADVPVKLEYSLNLWTKYVSDIDQLAASIRMKFNPSMNLKTSFSEVVKSFLTAETDASVTEVGDKEDRLIRKTFTVTVEAYIPSPKFKVTNTGKIEYFNTEAWFMP
jgi:hypothetical protein